VAANDWVVTYIVACRCSEPGLGRSMTPKAACLGRVDSIHRPLSHSFGHARQTYRGQHEPSEEGLHPSEWLDPPALSRRAGVGRASSSDARSRLWTHAAEPALHRTGVAGRLFQT
jgi:hypothetical protein